MQRAILIWPPAALVAFDSLRNGPEWRRWGELAADAPPYLAPQFFALVKPLVENGTAFVAEARNSDRMLGALPVVLEGDRLRALRTDHSPGFDYCGTEEGIDAIWNSLREDPRWNELVLDKLPARSLVAQRLPELARRDGCPVSVKPDTRHPYFALTGFEAAMQPKFRTNVQRCARKAGDLVLERIVTPSAADLADATRIEGMAWKVAAGASIHSERKITRIYEDVAQLPGAALYFLRIAGERIATLFSLEDRRTLFALKIGYDPAHGNLSPGHLLVWKAAQEAEARGLTEWNFLGREDEWKRRWTELCHEHVCIVIYQRSARGLVRHMLRDVIKPRLPEQMRTTPRSPLPRHCQRADYVGDHSLASYVRGRVHQGLGIKNGIRHTLARAPVARVGEPSRFAVGSWVRVAEAPQVDAAGKLRGLAFTPEQWRTTGGVFKVASHVRRLRDDKGRMRSVNRTVLLEGVDCSGQGDEPAGCGRHCPLMFRDEWLEPAEAQKQPAAAAKQRFARVRDAADIHTGLDLADRRDGLTFMPEMVRFAGKRLPIVGTIDQVFELDLWIATPTPLYILGEAHCSGVIAGGCDRACAILWHEDWLVIEAS